MIDYIALIKQVWYLPVIFIFLAIIKPYLKKPTRKNRKLYNISQKEQLLNNEAISFKEKGDNYEKFIANYYIKLGYKVINNGINKGKKDKGIDVICEKDNEIILIQCKNWNKNSRYKIGHNELKAFIGNCTEYLFQYNIDSKNVKFLFVSSYYILDKSAENFLKDSKTLKYEVIGIM